jgi:transcriptional regulator of NAD metabolism
MADGRESDHTGDVRRLYEEAESRTTRAFEEAVSRGSFGELLARMTENVVAMTKIGTDVFDLVLRNLRLAGRQDVTRLARQLNRTEDKLELVLQEVERVHEELARKDSDGARTRNGSTSRSRNKRARSGAGARAKETT